MHINKKHVSTFRHIYTPDKKRKFTGVFLLIQLPEINGTGKVDGSYLIDQILMNKVHKLNFLKCLVCTD